MVTFLFFHFYHRNFAKFTINHFFDLQILFVHGVGQNLHIDTLDSKEKLTKGFGWFYPEF